MNKFQKELIKFRKIVAARFDTSPSMYKFLVDKGIDDEIAEEAQELVTNAWHESGHKFDLMLENQINVINHCLAESMSDLSSKMEDMEDMVKGIRFEV